MKSFAIYPLLLLLIMCVSCQSSVDSKPVTENADTINKVSSDGVVSVENFAALLKQTSTAQLIDVRTPQEFNQGHIETAINFDFYHDDFLSNMSGLDKSQPVFIYCQSGGRSGKTYKMLKKMGIDKVYDLNGGYGAWSSK